MVRFSPLPHEPLSGLHWWARLDLNQQCSKATDLQSAALPIPLTDPFIRLGRSNRKLPFSVFFIKVQFPLRLSACLSSNRPCSHSFLINIPVRFVKLLLAPADRIELPPRESESLVLPLYEAGIKQDAFLVAKPVKLSILLLADGIGLEPIIHNMCKLLYASLTGAGDETRPRTRGCLMGF